MAVLVVAFASALAAAALVSALAFAAGLLSLVSALALVAGLAAAASLAASSASLAAWAAATSSRRWRSVLASDSALAAALAALLPPNTMSLMRRTRRSWRWPFLTRLRALGRYLKEISFSPRSWRSTSALTAAPSTRGWPMVDSSPSATSRTRSSVIVLPGSASRSSTSSSVPTSTRYCFPPVSMTAYMDPQGCFGATAGDGAWRSSCRTWDDARHGRGADDGVYGERPIRSIVGRLDPGRQPSHGATRQPHGPRSPSPVVRGSLAASARRPIATLRRHAPTTRARRRPHRPASRVVDGHAEAGTTSCRPSPAPPRPESTSRRRDRRAATRSHELAASARAATTPRPARAELRVEAGPPPTIDPAEPDIEEQRSQVVGDEPVALGPLPRAARPRPAAVRRPARERRRRDRVVGGRRLERHPVVRGGDPAGQRRSTQPDVLGPDEPPARRQHGLQRLAQPPGRPALGEDDIDELTLGRHPDRQRGAERDPWPRRRALGPGQGQPGGVDGGQPGIAQLALGEGRGIGRAGHDQTPALTSRWRRRGRGRRSDGGSVRGGSAARAGRSSTSGSLPDHARARAHRHPEPGDPAAAVRRSGGAR